MLSVGTYITFLKGYDAGFPKNSKFSINSCFEKIFSVGSLCTRGAAGIWAVDLFSTTYFGEIIIFVVSKDQTFRIRCTLMNPEQFLILVTHLIKTNLSSQIAFGFLDFHFNVPVFKSRFGHRNFSSTFRYYWNFGTIRTLDKVKALSIIIS